MQTTYGAMPAKKPKGYFKAVRFPILAELDTDTGDHRLLDSEGAGVRPLALTIRYQTKASYGHEGAEVSGALFEVTVDPEGKVMSGRGFLLDDDHGRYHARLIATQAMRTNSVDLADVTARFEEDLDTGDYRIRFTKYNLAATTGVATPAFAKAHAELEDDMDDDEMTAAMIADDDEIMASLLEDPMEELVASFDAFEVNVLLPTPEPEIVASAAAVQPYDAFYRPESETPHKIIVDADGNVYGHLGLWESCHDGILGRCTRIPRPTDSYASFNKPGVLTDRGIVETGPIFAYGGHRKANGADDLEQAYGSIENAWCDVRITEGRFGPWVAGRVRPGVDDDTVYAVRASRISGHWLAGRLKAIVSVNAEGFDVPGSGMADAAFAFSTDDDGVLELVASFPPCDTEHAPAPKVLDSADVAALADAVIDKLRTEAGAAASDGTPVSASALLLRLLAEDE